MQERLQIVFCQGGVVEFLLKLGGEVRTLQVDPAGAPWAPAALETQEVKMAVVNWMIETDAQGWIGATEFTHVLRDRGVSVDRLSLRFPAA